MCRNHNHAWHVATTHLAPHIDALHGRPQHRHRTLHIPPPLHCHRRSPCRPRPAPPRLAVQRQHDLPRPCHVPGSHQGGHAVQLHPGGQLLPPLPAQVGRDLCARVQQGPCTTERIDRVCWGTLCKEQRPQDVPCNRVERLQLHRLVRCAQHLVVMWQTAECNSTHARHSVCGLCRSYLSQGLVRHWSCLCAVRGLPVGRGLPCSRPPSGKRQCGPVGKGLGTGTQAGCLVQQSARRTCICWCLYRHGS